MTPQSAKNKNKFILCRRCKHNNVDYPSSRICSVCKEHCSKCGCKLHIHNINRPQLKLRKNYICKVCVAQTVRNSRKPEDQKNYDLKRNYNLNLESYKILCELQENKCKICGSIVKTLVVDHCHKTKKVRGLLCSSCNTGLGHFKDNKKWLRNAIQYLETHESPKCKTEGQTFTAVGEEHNSNPFP